MSRSGKFYVHVEDVEPNYTVPYTMEPTMTFASLSEAFCTKYNGKHSAVMALSPQLVDIKVGSKIMEKTAFVAEHVSPGEDVHVLGANAKVAAAEVPVNGAANATTQNGHVTQDAQAQPPLAQGPADPVKERTPLAKKMKVYVHYESGSDRKDASATQMFPITEQEHSVAELIEAFVLAYNTKNASEPLDMHMLCARTDSQLVVPAEAMVAKTFKNGDDIWIVPLETAIKENNAAIDVPSDANAIERSKLRAKDKSYYYWAQKHTGEEPAPQAVPKQIRTREAKREEMVSFKTISTYSFESEDGFVKVYISLPGIGDLPPESHEFECQERSLSLRIYNYNGFNHRLQVPKLSEFIIPSESSVRFKKDMVIVKLSKVKKDYHWYELHKTKGIGEKDD